MRARGHFPRVMAKRLTQTTLDESTYIERNRLGQPVVRREKRQESDYVLAVFGSQRLQQPAWVMEQLDFYVRTHRRGVKPQQVLVPDGKGVATAARQWAAARGVDVRVVSVAPYLAQWPRSEYKTVAFKRRDKDLLDLASAVVTFWERKRSVVPTIVTRADKRGKLARTFYFVHDA